MRAPRLTRQTLQVLSALLEDPGEPRYGLQLAEAARVKTTTIYDTLMRLETAGWVLSQWERQTPQTLGRPRRRLYRLTSLGAEAAAAAVQAEVARLTHTARVPTPARPVAVRPSLRPTS